MNRKTISVRKKIILSSIILFMIILFFELFIFNYRFYLTSGGHQKNYSLQDLNIYGATINEDSSITCNNNRVSIYINKIDLKVKSLYVDLSFEEKTDKNISLDIYYQDATRNYYNKSNKAMNIIYDYTMSKYTKCDFFGDTKNLCIYINDCDNETISFNGITINKQIPLNISIGRLLIITFISYLVLFSFFLFKYDSKDKTKLHRNIRIVATLIGLVLIVLTYALYGGFRVYFLLESGTQITKELVDSFKAGTFSLLTKPNPVLLALDNPYNPSSRYGIFYLWDHLLYNGNYYSYYGIAPVLTLCLPINILTGKYIFDAYVCLIFAIIGLVFLSITYFNFIKQKFSQIPFSLELTGFIILFMGCGVLLCMERPYFYEIAELSAFCFMMIGLYFLVEANFLQSNCKISIIKSIFASTFISLAVLSRPTFSLYCLCALIWLFYIFFKVKKIDKKRSYMLLLLSLLPYMFFGGFQMFYNFKRFGSIFDFGIQYSLTINDFTNTEFKLNLALISIWNFLFSPPIINDVPYFIHGNSLTFGANGFYYFETYNTFGLFLRTPIMFLLFLAPYFYKNISYKEKLKKFILTVLPCVIFPIIIVILTWESGYATRYNIDFSVPLIIISLIIVFKIYDRNKQNYKLSRLILVVMLLLSVWSLIANYGLALQYIPGVTHYSQGVEIYDLTNYYYSLARDLAFWY